ncbi:MAG: hypothetical protein WAX69_16920 [Victivallales bacterium]
MDIIIARCILFGLICFIGHIIINEHAKRRKMLNTFSYGADIPPNVRAKLVERESLCESAVFETSPLDWTRKVDKKNRPLYILTKRELLNVELCRFTESEIFNLSDDDFKEKVFLKDIDRQRQKEYIIKRIQEWRKRLTSLFNEIEEWMPTGWEFRKSQIVQRNEELMTLYGVLPQELPVIMLTKNKERISFVPSALWIIGADGRVNITTNTSQLILVDRRQDHSSPSRWEIILGKNRSRTVPFTRTVFLDLLMRGEA